MDRTNVIGEKVKSLRTAKEISLEELADRTGLAVEQIHVSRKILTFLRSLRL